MTALPSQVPKRLQNNSHVVKAYNTCLELERSLQNDIDDSEGKNLKIERNMIYCRILGYFFHFLPTHHGIEDVCNAVISCADDSALLDLGKTYFDHYIRAFRTKKCRTPTPSHDASPPSARPQFDKLADMIRANLVEAPQSHADAKKIALIRDRFRCVVTGKYDHRSVRENRELYDIASSDPDSTGGLTYCAHIFAAPTNEATESGLHKYAASMWALMKHFGYTTLPDELNGHRLENVMSLCVDFHSLFDDLWAWFVATDEQNTYKIGGIDSIYLRQYPEYVTFTTPDEVKLPVPSPVYLAIHAACAQVAHMSGATKYIDKLDRDIEDGTNLDPNGASAEMLEHALIRLQA